MLWLCAQRNGWHNLKVGEMAVFINPTAIRALILAVILACFAAITAPTARGATADNRHPTAGSKDKSPSSLPAACCPLPAGALLADDWSWHEFVKFWQRQAGSMTGVVGTVLLVGAGAVILVLHKGKG